MRSPIVLAWRGPLLLPLQRGRPSAKVLLEHRRRQSICFWRTLEMSLELVIAKPVEAVEHRVTPLVRGFDGELNRGAPLLARL